RVCEWIGPMVYRKDDLGSATRTVTNTFKGGRNVKYTWVTIYENSFGDAKTWRGNPPAHAAVVSNAKPYYKVDDLWECLAIEPEAALLFLLMVKEQSLIPSNASSYWLNGSFFPFRSSLSERKLQ